MASLKKHTLNKRLMTDYITSSPGIDENTQAVQRVKAGTKKDISKGTEAGRVSLRVLQPSSNNVGLTRPETEHDKPLVSRKRKLDDDVIHSPCKRVRAKPHKAEFPVKVFQDTPKKQKESSRVDVETQTEGATGGACSCDCHPKEAEQKSPEDEAYELMCGETVPEGYWKAMAEERRTALADSLEENCELHGRLQEQLDEIERLTELANQAEYFASILRAATEDSDDDAVEEDQPNEQHETSPDEESPESSPGPSSPAEGHQSTSEEHTDDPEDS